MTRQCAGNVSIGKSLYCADRRRERQIARRIKTKKLSFQTLLPPVGPELSCYRPAGPDLSC